MENYSYSIIIPHKNIPNLLRRCLSSIPRRKDIQTIVVDDNSDLNSTNLETLKSAYPKVEFLSVENNRGAGACRNIGLENALGKWVIFIDADDYLIGTPADVWDSCYNSDADVVYFNITSADCDKMTIATRHLEKENEFKRLAKNQAELERYLRFKFTEPWGKLFRRDFLIQYNITFQESIVANDYLFSVLTGLYARKIEFSNHIFYCVTVRQDSLSYSMFNSNDRLFSRMNVYHGIQELFDMHRIKLYPYYSFVWQAIIISKTDRAQIFNHSFSLGYTKFKLIKGLLKASFYSFKSLILRKLKLPYSGF